MIGAGATLAILLLLLAWTLISNPPAEPVRVERARNRAGGMHEEYTDGQHSFVHKGR